MKFKNTEIFNFEGAFRGMRNPLNSWDKSDSKTVTGANKQIVLGANDLDLAQRLIKGGSEHRKFMRQILVCVDITAPLYFWSEFDTYKVGTTANSTSTMHKLASTPITSDCFECDDYNDDIYTMISTDDEEVSIADFDRELLERLDNLRLLYLETGDKKYWKALVRRLPRGWLQTRTVTLSYENLRNMYFQRKNHKLTEWSVSFIKWVETLPYAKELICFE